MEQVTLQEALDYCLENPDSLGVPELLDRFPQHRVELEPLLRLGLRIEASAPPPIPDARRSALKARLMQAAAAQQTMQPFRGTPEPAEPLISTTSASVRKFVPQHRRSWFRGWLQKPAWVMVAVVALLVATVWPASAGSLPDSPFYNVKLGTENLLLNFASGAVDRVRGHIKLANSRLFDLQAMNGQGKLAASEPAFSSYEYHLGSGFDGWQGVEGDEVRVELARSLYVSGVAGQKIFSGLGAQVDSLPEALRDTVESTVKTIGELNNSTGAALKSAGLDPDQVLREAESEFWPLLTPVPKVPESAVVPPNPSEAVVEPTATTAIVAATEETSLVEATATTLIEQLASPSPTSGSTGSNAASPTAAQVASATTAATPFTPQPTATLTGTATVATKPNGSGTTRTPAQRSATPTSSVTATPVKLSPTQSAPAATFTAARTALPLNAVTILSTATASEAPRLADGAVATPPLCSLTVSNVVADCEAGNCIRWSANITNGGTEPVSANWRAVLQYHLPGDGPFRTLSVKEGIASFSVGTAPSRIGDSFCVSLPEGANNVKVVVSFISRVGKSACVREGASEKDAPCLQVRKQAGSPSDRRAITSLLASKKGDGHLEGSEGRAVGVLDPEEISEWEDEEDEADGEKP